MTTRNITIIPRAPFARILLNSGAKRVSQSAINAFADVMTDIAEKISLQAIRISQHAGRKTIHDSDIELAIKSI